MAINPLLPKRAREILPSNPTVTTAFLDIIRVWTGNCPCDFRVDRIIADFRDLIAVRGAYTPFFYTRT
jgi:hypothetical protein